MIRTRKEILNELRDNDELWSQFESWEDEDGSIANVEVQKIGYLFPGERSACYSADMLLRQYKRVRRELGKKFHYRDIKKVYTIVLFEKSNSVFKSFSKDIYIHRFQQQSDSGIELNLLQEYTFICLDIFDTSFTMKAEKETVD